MVTSAQIFKQIEIADNFLKYAKPGTEEKARDRARRRYDKALKMAMASADDQTVNLVKLRLNDLARTTVRDAQPEVEGYEPSGGSITASELPEHARDRVPPGRRVTRGWPVLHVGGVPRFDATTWRLEVTGEVERGVSLSYAELKALPLMEMRSGFPLRLVVPKFYAWKSVKWVQTFELITSDKRGFWELRGYHNRADPWLEERYSYQEA